MSVQHEVLNTISAYFPKNIAFDDIKYKLSPEYANTLRVRHEHLSDCSSKGINLYKQLCELFKDYVVVDWTDLKSSNCYEYRILLHKGQPILDDDTELMTKLNGRRLDLFLFISILKEYYYYFVNESLLDDSTGNWTFRSIVESLQIIDNITELDDFMNKKGYVKLSTEFVQRTVDDIETELFDRGQIKVFNCLFTELISI